MELYNISMQNLCNKHLVWSFSFTIAVILINDKHCTPTTLLIFLKQTHYSVFHRGGGCSKYLIIIIKHLYYKCLIDRSYLSLPLYNSISCKSNMSFTNIIFCLLLLTVHNTDPEQQIRSRATRHAACGDWVAKTRVAVATLGAISVSF